MITLIDDYMCNFIPLDILHYICQPKVEVNENAFKKKKHLEAAKGELRYAEDVNGSEWENWKRSFRSVFWYLILERSTPISVRNVLKVSQLKSSIRNEPRP